MLYEISRKSLMAIPAAATLLLTGSFVAPEAEAETENLGSTEATLAQISEYSADDMGQITSVSQLSDVQPTDWAFQALQSLVERYGCIVGYPDGTYRGNRALTRYEFAAGLNACLDRINELIASATADLATKEDLAVLQRLQEEFQAELATIRGRVDALEARTAELEANQFSTTTKLAGEALFSLNDSFSFNTDNDDPNTTFGGRVRLNLNTSFTGDDLLRTRLQARNIFAKDGQLEYSGSTVDGSENPEFQLDDLWYRFSLYGAEFQVGPWGVTTDDFVPTVAYQWNGLMDFFGDNVFLYDTVGDEAGIGGNYQIGEHFNIAAGYTVDDDADCLGGGETCVDENGFIFGNSTGFVQLTGTFGDFESAIGYTRNYSKEGGIFDLLGTGNSGFNATGGTGPFTQSSAASIFGGSASSSDMIGASVSYQFSDNFIVSAFGGFGWGRSEVFTTNAQVYTAALAFEFPDLFREGNRGGVAVGIPPTVSDGDGIIVVDDELLSLVGDDNMPIAIDAYYTLRLSDNIDITPGVFVFINEYGDDISNDDTVLGAAIRTRFRF